MTDHPSARDLVRRRRGDYRAPDTGRHHHLGAAPEAQPVLGDEGTATVETSPVQLRQRTSAQLEEMRGRYARRMADAATALDFEAAALARDALAAVEAEQARRTG